MCVDVWMWVLVVQLTRELEAGALPLVPTKAPWLFVVVGSHYTLQARRTLCFFWGSACKRSTQEQRTDIKLDGGNIVCC